jgi:chaperonin GroES
MQIKPLADRVVVRPYEEQEVKRGGIIIPDTAKEKPMEGEIIEIGPGRTSEEGKRMPLEVKKGDRILYGKYSGTEVTVNGEEYLIMRESDIFAVIQKA